MRLTEFLREDGILLNFSARDKWTAIQGLADAACRTLKEKDKKAALAALAARERAASTGLEHGIAIPHAKVSGIQQPMAAMGLSPEGIPFQCQDGKPAQIIVLLVIPIASVALHIRTLAAVAHLLNFEELRQALLSAKTPQEALGLLKEEELKEPPSR